jgi:branched-chain amino acid transport system ATP-binding protein
MTAEPTECSTGCRPGAAKPLLALDDVHVHLAGAHILQGVGFTVAERGVTALLGRNGAGKTTTLAAIMGLVPSTGEIRFAGEALQRKPTHQVARRGIGYVPEDREVFAGLTVAENLRLAERGHAAANYGLVHELFPELKDRARQRAGTLSGGQQQMLSLARALLGDNRLLLIDEPTKGLAPRVVSEVADALGRASAATTVLLVEQHLALVRRLADHVAVLAAGQIVHTGPAAELLDDAGRTRNLLGVGKAGDAA